ncbi:MAG: dihydrolipoamide acetyltransferase family protein [Lautropia sp.]
MAAHVVKMPDIGEGIAEVEIVAWHVAQGDAVAEDQVVAEVMTDKASVEIPAPVAGRVVALGGGAGDVLAVGAPLLTIEVGTVGGAVGAGGGGAVPAPTADRARAAPPVAAVAAVATPVPVPSAGATPPPSATSRRATRDASGRPLAPPSVRQRAWDLGIDLRVVRGSGEAGVIRHEDLDAWIAAEAGGPPDAGERHDADASSRRQAPGERADAIERVPVIGLRRRIAERMQDAKRRIPHFSYVEEIDVTELDALRASLNARWGASHGRLTVLPLLLRAMVTAIASHPAVNARFDDEAGVVHRHRAVHAGIATQTPAGLLVPVLRDVQALDPWAVAAGIARLADAARSGKAARADLGGSTITVTSLGALGGIVTTPVINAPEVAIVGVNRIVERPVVRGGAVVVRKMMNLSSSFDHRVVDGMDAARFVQSIRELLETPALLFAPEPGQARP